MVKEFQRSGEFIRKKNRKYILFVSALFFLLITIVFMNFFDYMMDPRNASGIHFAERNRIVTYSSPSSWLGDGLDYDVYHFGDEQMDKIIKKIKSKSTWKRYPVDSTTSKLISEWYGFMENQINAQVFMEESEIEELIPEIENGYYLSMDRSDHQGEESKGKYGLRNYSVFLLDTDSNTLFYIASDM